VGASAVVVAEVPVWLAVVTEVPVLLAVVTVVDDSAVVVVPVRAGAAEVLLALLGHSGGLVCESEEGFVLSAAADGFLSEAERRVL